MASEEAAVPTDNLAHTVSAKIAETIQHMNVLDTLRKMVATDSQDEESNQVKTKLQAIIDKYAAMSDEDKLSFEGNVKDVLTSKLSMKLQDSFSNIQGNIESAIKLRLGLLAIGVFVFVVLLVFFGYKLYKSIKDKEVKREEKKKAKQMKKKK